MAVGNQICTIQVETVCSDCAIKGQLNCRYEEKRFYQQDSLKTIPIYLPFFSITLVGFLTGQWWMLVYYTIVYLAVFQSGLAQAWLCRHCPYYSQDCSQLFCGLHNGSRKWLKYSPRPLNKLEKSVPIIIFPSLQLFPLMVEGYGIWFSYTNIESLGSFPLFVLGIVFCVHIAGNARFVYYLTQKMCPRCVNFSCLFNRVPAEVVEAYLEKSPTMKAAWLASGYQMKTHSTGRSNDPS